MKAAYRVVLVDDEPLARDRLRILLESHDAYDVIAECGDAREALTVIDRERPDVALVDIQMPGMNGVELAQSLVRRAQPPLIVFVTAHDQVALKAFDVSAEDYLVKPVDIDRFERTIARVGDRLRGDAPRPLRDEIRVVLEELQAAARPAERFVVRSPRGHYFVKTEDVESATAEGNYVALSVNGRAHLVRATMASFESRVHPDRFLRIHRSVMVNIDRIARIEPLGHGQYRVTMRSGERFESSRSYSARFRELFDQ